MALDEPKENDEIFEIQDLTFLIDKMLKKYLRALEIDYNDGGFRPGFIITPQWSKEDLFAGTCSI